MQRQSSQITFYAQLRKAIEEELSKTIFSKDKVLDHALKQRVRQYQVNRHFIQFL